MARRILLSGSHGVGKGYFISHKLSKYKNVSIVSASDVLSRYKNVEDAGNKRVKDVRGNQIFILNALHDYIETHKETVVMDGHLVIVDSNDCIQRIPKDYFVKEVFDTVLLLQDDSRKIYKRMYDRDGLHKLSIEKIEQIQYAEKVYAEELSDAGIEVVIISPDNDIDYRKLFE